MYLNLSYNFIKNIPEPTNKTLYNKVKSAAKRKFKVYPSAYANGWLVKEYKRRGGKYSGNKSQKSGLSRWYKEKWINVCKLPRKVPCGRSKMNSKYPYCRPLKRITSKTPRLSSSLSKAKIKKMCNPMKKSKSLRRKRSGKK